MNCLQVALVADSEPFHFEDFLCRFVILLVHGKNDLTPNHHICQLGGIGLGRVDGVDDPSRPHDCDTVRYGEDFLEFVSDEDDRNTTRSQIAHDAEEVFRFLRGQHCGRFVKDDDLCVAIQGLDDLDTLLNTDGQIADKGIRVDVQTVLFGNLIDPCGDGGAIQ